MWLGVSFRLLPKGSVPGNTIDLSRHVATDQDSRTPLTSNEVAGMMPVRQAPRRGRSQDSLRTIAFHMQDQGQEHPGVPGIGPSNTLGSAPKEASSLLVPGQGAALPASNFTFADEDFPSLTASKGPSAKGSAAKVPPSKPGKALGSNPGAGPARPGNASLSRPTVRRPASEPDLSGPSQQDLG